MLSGELYMATKSAGGSSYAIIKEGQLKQLNSLFVQETDSKWLKMFIFKIIRSCWGIVMYVSVLVQL